VPPSCSHAGHHHHHHRKDGGAKASNKTQTRKDGSHHSDSCPDTQDIPLVRAEGGMLRGSLVLPKPVELADRSTGDRGDGLIGRFWLPCSVKGVKGAWLLCGYQCREKECLYRKVIGGCCV
jgi:hypothetical protein